MIALHGFLGSAEDWGALRDRLPGLRAVDLPGRTIVAYANLVNAELFLGNVEEAAAVLAAMEREYPEASLIPQLQVSIALLVGAPDRAEAVASAIWNDPTQPPLQRVFAIRDLAAVAAHRGQLAAARRYMEQAIELADRSEPAAAAMQRLMAGVFEAFLGDRDRAARQYVDWVREGAIDLASLPPVAVTGVAATIARGGIDRSELEEIYAPLGGVPDAVADVWALAELRLDDPAAALAVLEERVEGRGCRTDHCALLDRAGLSADAGDHDTALELWERLARRGAELPPLTGFQDMAAKLWLGPEYEAAGRTAEAIAAYQRVVEQCADADEEGQVIVRRFQERIRALGGG